MEQAKLNEIIEIFMAKGVNMPCPRCGTLKFNVAGESFIAIQENPNVINLGGPSIPTIIVVCENCGYVTQHAKGSLGLMKGAPK